MEGLAAFTTNDSKNGITVRPTSTARSEFDESGGRLEQMEEAGTPETR
jgi:hypothetical protein